MAFLYIDFDDGGNDVEIYVKQTEGSGTSIHKPWGITGFFGGKTP
jgi:hypothetical protein